MSYARLSRQLNSSGTGPITSVELIEWLASCQQDFDDFQDDNGGTGLTERQKIRAIGASFKNEGRTKDLYDWYITQPISSQTYAQFKASLLKHVLGKSWTLDVLRDFHANRQGDKSVHDYIHTTNALVLEVNSISGQPPNLLSTLDIKAHLLFNADPGILAAIIKNDIKDQRDFLRASKDEIEELLAKYEGSKTGPRGIPNIGPNIGSNPNPGTITIPNQGGGSQPRSTLENRLFVVTGLAGSNIPYSWPEHSDVTRLSEFETIPHLDSFVATVGNSAVDYYAFKYGISGAVCTLGMERPRSTKVEIVFGRNEYMKTVKVSSGAGGMHGTSVNSMVFITNEGREYHVGTQLSASPTVFTAPDGWRVIGFQSCFQGQKSDCEILGIGCVFGPI